MSPNTFPLAWPRSLPANDYLMAHSKPVMHAYANRTFYFLFSTLLDCGIFSLMNTLEDWNLGILWLAFGAWNWAIYGYFDRLSLFLFFGGGLCSPPSTLVKKNFLAFPSVSMDMGLVLPPYSVATDCKFGRYGTTDLFIFSTIILWTSNYTPRGTRSALGWQFAGGACRLTWKGKSW